MGTSGANEQKSLKLVVADPDPLLRPLFADIASREGEYALSGVVALWEELVDCLRREPVHLVLIDIRMAGEMPGGARVRWLRQLYPRTDVIVVSAEDDPCIVRESLCAGVFDYLLKPFQFDRLDNSLRAYARYYRGLVDRTRPWRQEELDGVLRGAGDQEAIDELLRGDPKGIQPQALQNLIYLMRESAEPVTAKSLGVALGIGRSTAQRYLEFLVQRRQAAYEYSYSKVGRPSKCYRLLPAP